jgi:hypothetical protein
MQAGCRALLRQGLHFRVPVHPHIPALVPGTSRFRSTYAIARFFGTFTT